MDYLDRRRKKNQINLQSGKCFNKYDNSVIKLLNVTHLMYVG